MAKKKPSVPNRLKLKALTGLSGKYNLPFSENQVFTIDAKRGQEIVDNGDAVIQK